MYKSRVRNLPENKKVKGTRGLSSGAHVSSLILLFGAMVGLSQQLWQPEPSFADTLQNVAAHASSSKRKRQDVFKICYRRDFPNQLRVRRKCKGAEAAWPPPGINIQGERGATGPQGEAGPAGEMGPAGPQGVPGAPGEKGDKGEKGDTGAIGPQGPQGPVGPTGPQGLQGAAGEKGDRGEKGEKGDTGAIGPQGPQGPTGAQGPKGDTGTVSAGLCRAKTSSNPITCSDAAHCAISHGEVCANGEFMLNYGYDAAPDADVFTRDVKLVLDSSSRHAIGVTVKTQRIPSAPAITGAMVPAPYTLSVTVVCCPGGVAAPPAGGGGGDKLPKVHQQ